MSKEKNNLWTWDSTEIILKNPDGEEVFLSSIHLSDEAINLILKSLDKFVTERGGELE